MGDGHVGSGARRGRDFRRASREGEEGRGVNGGGDLVAPIPIWIGGVGGESEWGRECVVGGLGFQDVGG